jgi:hypothetical protein
MRQVKISKWLVSAVVCSLLLATGCTPVSKEATKPEVKPEKKKPKAAAKDVANMELKFSPGDSTTYRVITEAERSLKWEGNVPDEPTFKGGRNYDRLEMTFSQEIQSVNDMGNAIAKITVKELKSSSISKDSLAFEFDSLKPKDPNHPLAKLIGQSYTIKITPTGKIIEVADTKKAELAVSSGSAPPRVALRLLQPEIISERHGTLILPDANKNQLHIGDNWSNTKTFFFGMMGSESYEKIYTLKAIKDQDNRRLAFIEMNAIPASKTSKEQVADYFKDSDSNKIYTGELKLDLTTGKIDKYSEKQQSEWITVFPSTEQKTGKEGPAVLTMSDIRIYNLEKID